MQAAQDRQKSYADRIRKPMEFEVGDRVMLKVSSWKGVVRFIMPLEGIHVDNKLQFVEEPVEIMEREIKRLKRSRIPLVKIRTFEGVTDWYQSQGYREPAVMSSASSAVTYTSVYTDSEPGRAFWGADDEEISEGGIPRVIVLGYDGLPIQPVAPPSPDYIPGPEDPQTPPVPQDEDEREPMFVQAHDPDYVPEPIYPEYIPLEDEHEFPAEEQPLPPVDSPTAESPGYVTESDPEEDPEEYEDDETEDGPVDYPMDGGDDGDDDDGDSSRDDANDEDEDDEDEEEEEHLAPADSAIVVPVDEPVFPPEGTEPASHSLPPEAEVERLLAMTTQSPSPPISLSPPYAGEHLARCMALPTHSLPLLPSSGCPTQIQTLRITSTQALIDAVTVALPLPPSLYIPPPVDRKDDIPESEQPPRKRLYLSTLGSRYEVGESSTARPTRGRGIDYRFVSMVDAKKAQGLEMVYTRIRILGLDPTRELLGRQYGWVEEETLLFPRGLGSIDRSESRRTPSERQTHRDHVTLQKCPNGEPLTFKGTEGGVGSRGKGNDFGKFVGLFKKQMTDKISPRVNPDITKPKTLDETIELANDLMDQKLRTYAERQSDNKRKADDSSRNNHGHQQQPFKRQNVAKVYNMGTGEKKPYRGSLPKSAGNTNVANTQKGNVTAPKGNYCFECGAPRHFKRDCPKLRNKDGGNGNAQGWVYAVGNAEKRGNALGNPDANVVDRISAKKEEDKSEGKQIKDVPIVQDFPEVFPEDLHGGDRDLPHTPASSMNSKSTIIPGAAPVARAPYRIGSYEMKELSEPLQESFF
ncbi:putative reverse transcriptase domain-containing protein [Tanacetum coccineum]